MYCEAEVAKPSRAFQPALSESAPHNALISGPSGVGKTVLARHTLNRLEKRAPVTHVHIPSLRKASGRSSVKPSDSTQPTSVTNSRETRPSTTSTNFFGDTAEYPFIVILDEADNIHDHDVLESLHAVPRLSIVAICHDPQSWLDQAPMGDSHSFDGDRHIQLRRYAIPPLADIFEARANQQFANDLVTRHQPRLIPNHVAGVAQLGIQALYADAELAVESSHARLRPLDVDDSYDQAFHRVRQSNRNSLPLHHHLLYELIRVADEVSDPQFHERYENAAEQS